MNLKHPNMNTTTAISIVGIISIICLNIRMHKHRKDIMHEPNPTGKYITLGEYNTIDTIYVEKPQ